MILDDNYQVLIMEKRYKISEFAALTGRSPQTLRDWDKSGQLAASRTAANHRYYTEADIERAIALQKSIAKVSDRPALEALQSKLQQAMELIKEVQESLNRKTW